MERKIETPSSTKKWIYGSVILILALIAFFLLRRRKRVTEPGTVKPNYIEKFNEIVALQLSGKAFCFEIQKLSKEITKDSNLSFEQNQELEAIQKDCQLLIYADVDSEIKTQELNKRIQNFLRELDPGHSAYL